MKVETAGGDVVLPDGRAGDEVEPLMVVVPRRSMMRALRSSQRRDRLVNGAVGALAVLVTGGAVGMAAESFVGGHLLMAVVYVCVSVVGGAALWFSLWGGAGWWGHHHMANPIDCAGYVVASNERAMRRLFNLQGAVEPVTGDRAYAYAYLHHQAELCERHLVRLRDEMAVVRAQQGNDEGER